MKISVLVENSVCKTDSADVKPEHGLSLYIEFCGYKILFDTGQSDLFIQNSIKLGIDLSLVDLLIVSHGHFDHGGGLSHFLQINKKAKIFMHRHATHKYYTRIFKLVPYYVGLDLKVISQNIHRIYFIDQDAQIGDKIFLLEGFPLYFPQPESNKELFEKPNKVFIPDIFRHEIAMVLIENGESVLFSGCSHSGIMNIVEKANSFNDESQIKAIFGGLHIHNPISKKNESRDYIEKLSDEMLGIDSVFYTGHCTGEANFNLMQEKLGVKIQTMKTGDIFVV
jgi:7,8-dihydropterin-6-yl-methyl-4-(beta-D-ribofuranosyl)aminobenzene 5'-phosphate synthase